jgi:hypothetical protein
MNDFTRDVVSLFPSTPALTVMGMLLVFVSVWIVFRLRYFILLVTGTGVLAAAMVISAVGTLGVAAQQWPEMQQEQWARAAAAWVEELVPNQVADIRHQEKSCLPAVYLATPLLMVQFLADIAILCFVPWAWRQAWLGVHRDRIHRTRKRFEQLCR